MGGDKLISFLKFVTTENGETTEDSTDGLFGLLDGLSRKGVSGSSFKGDDFGSRFGTTPDSSFDEIAKYLKYQSRS